MDITNLVESRFPTAPDKMATACCEVRELLGQMIRPESADPIRDCSSPHDVWNLLIGPIIELGDQKLHDDDDVHMGMLRCLFVALNAHSVQMRIKVAGSGGGSDGTEYVHRYVSMTREEWVEFHFVERRAGTRSIYIGKTPYGDEAAQKIVVPGDSAIAA